MRDDEEDFYENPTAEKQPVVLDEECGTCIKFVALRDPRTFAAL